MIAITASQKYVRWNISALITDGKKVAIIEKPRHGVRRANGVDGRNGEDDYLKI